jgi:hypothetical protein
VPTFPGSPVPRAKITVTSVQQFPFKTPLSVDPPPFPWGVQLPVGVDEAEGEAVEDCETFGVLVGDWETFGGGVTLKT